MSEDRAKQLAQIYQAIEDVQTERADANTEFKERIENLRQEADRLRHDILTGQMTIPMEPTPA